MSDKDDDSLGGKALSMAERKAAFQTMNELLPDVLNEQTIWAQIRFGKYQALQRAGFSGEEALKIVVADGPVFN